MYVYVCVGLNEIDIEGDWLIERQALWVVPSELKRELKPAMTEDEEEIQGLIDPVNQDVFIFKLEDCSLKALVSVSTRWHGVIIYMYMYMYSYI